jgi:23S rRNA (cytosine1962-C5)-methyltransferase
MASVILRRGRANPIWQGHPWVFSGAIEREEGAFQPGDAVEVRDADGKLIGRGLCNPRSQIRVRMITWRDEAVDAALIARRIDEAIALRRCLGLPSELTDAYRLVNAEGDGLPGLIVDRYADVLAVQFTALGMKRLEVEVMDALARALEPRAIVEIGGGGFQQLEGFSAATRVVRGEHPLSPVRCRENGLSLDVDPLHGQKTGMFLDQRVNRRRIGELAARARVLDVYTYAGGFALNALRHGATSATCVDSSQRALERAQAHAQLNGLSNLEVVEADAFRFLETATPRSFDVVVVDPPKFARAKKDLPAALKGYQRLNALALNACKEGALLSTCSCSQLVDAETFERVLAAAARDAGRRLQLLELAFQGPDHPVPPAFPEGRYLKVCLCRVI